MTLVVMLIKLLYHNAVTNENITFTDLITNLTLKAFTHQGHNTKMQNTRLRIFPLNTIHTSNTSTSIKDLNRFTTAHSSEKKKDPRTEAPPQLVPDIFQDVCGKIFLLF